MERKTKTMAVLGVLIVGMSFVFAGGAFASSSNHMSANSGTATHEHQNATDPAGNQHAGNQVGATGTGGAPDHTENGSAVSEDSTGNATDPAGNQHAGGQVGATGAGGDNSTDGADNSA